MTLLPPILLYGVHAAAAARDAAAAAREEAAEVSVRHPPAGVSEGARNFGGREGGPAARMVRPKALLERIPST